MPKEYRTIFMQVQPAAIRTATFDNREHLVVPVIALVEGVLHAINAPNPELVLAEEFSQAPQGWNGRPVVGDHPVLDGQRVSANIPEVLEKESFGLLFNTRVEGKQLKTEAWLDPRRAENVGEEALQVLERARNGETIEVSVGAFVATENAPGEFEGKPFVSIWREIVPDHLAMLPKGAIGACSVEMGCGAPRAARIYDLSASGYTLVAASGCECNNKEPKVMEPKQLWQEYKDKLKDLKSKATSFIRFNGPDGDEEEMSDQDMREVLSSALQASEPGFLGVDAVFMDSSKVVFAADPEGPLQFFRVSFTVGDNSVVTLGDDKEEVRIEQRFVPVVAQSTNNNQGESEMDEAKKARILALISSGKTSFVEGDLEYLGTLPEERLAQLEASIVPPVVTPPVDTPVPVAQADGAGDAVPAQTEEEMEVAYLKAAPKSIQVIVARAKREEAEKRNQLVIALKAAQSAFTEPELVAMPIEQLEKLATVAASSKPAPVNFGGMGAPRVAEDSEIPTPKSIVEIIRSRNSA